MFNTKNKTKKQTQRQKTNHSLLTPNFRNRDRQKAKAEFSKEDFKLNGDVTL